MEIKEYQEKAMRTKNNDLVNNLSLSDLQLLDGALGLSGESGEIADMVKKHFFQGHDFKKCY